MILIRPRISDLIARTDSFFAMHMNEADHGLRGVQITVIILPGAEILGLNYNVDKIEINPFHHSVHA